MKNIQIMLPNFQSINHLINDDDGAASIYDKIEQVNPGWNQNIKLKKNLSEDDIKCGEKPYDFGNIRNNEKISAFIIEPIYESIEDVILLTKCGSDFWGPEYVHACRYHFKIKSKSVSILYDFDLKKFAMEPFFHKGFYSVINDLKPFLSSHPLKDMVFGPNPNLSMKYKVKWFSTLSELLIHISEEEGSNFHENSIQKIIDLYETHKYVINKL
jgi:hypothetical protein